MKPNAANKAISKDDKKGHSNTQTSSEILMQERNCQKKSKTRKRKIEANTQKHCSYSLSQPILSPNSTTSTRHTLRNWQPPLKIFRYGQNTKNTAENFIPDTMPSTSFGSGEEVSGNIAIATDSTGAPAEEGQTDNETISCNGNNQEDISSSQQSTQEYAPKETTEMEDGKHEEPEIDGTNVTENCAIQEGEKNKSEDNSDQMAQKLHNTSNKDTSLLNVRVMLDRNSCNQYFIEHSEEKTDQSSVSTKHIQNNDIPSATKVDTGTEKDKQDSKLNIISKSDVISASGINFLVKINESSHGKEKEKSKPSYDTVMCQIQSLTVKYPQYMRSIRTLIGSDEDSPLPLDLFLNDSQLPWNKTGKMEQMTEIQTISQETTHKITENKTGDNQCEEKGSLSGQVLTSQAEADKNNHSSLVKTEDQQTVCSFQNKSQQEYEESTFMPSLVQTDILLNKSDVHVDKIMQNLTTSELVAEKPSEICNVESTKLQGCTDQANMVTVTPIHTVESTKTQRGMEQADTDTMTPICTMGSIKLWPGTHQADKEAVIPISTVQSTKLQRGTEQADSETATPICTVQSTKLQRVTEQADSETVTPICALESTKLQQGTEEADTETVTAASLPDPYPKLNIRSKSIKMTTNTCELKEAQNLETASAEPEDNLEKIKDLLVSAATTGNKCTEEHLIRNYEEASSDTASHSAVTIGIKTGQPGSGQNKSNENGSKCPVKTVTESMRVGEKAGNTGPLYVTHQSPTKKKCLSEQNEINQPNIGFRMSEDTFSKFSLATEISNVGSCPTSSMNKIDIPGIDNHCINENSSEQSAKTTEGIKDTAKTGITEPVNTLHSSASVTKKFLPKQDGRNQSEMDVNKPKDIFHKFPTATATSSCSTVAPNNETDRPGNDLNNHFTDKHSKQPMKNTDGKDGDVNTGNIEPLRIVHPSTPTRKEFHPQQDAINQCTIGFYNSKNIFCKSPTAATEAPNILGQLGKDSPTKEYKHDTASHGYLLDDDIGLTGSQLLRIEDQCQYNNQGAEEEWNYASRCGEARVPDTDMLPTPKWAQIMQQKRQKLRSIIGDISRLK